MACADAQAVSGVCAPPSIRCSPGQAFTVTVVGHGAGIARCGGGEADCRTTGVVDFCDATGTATSSGTLSCSVDPIGSGPAVAVCAMAARI